MFPYKYSLNIYLFLLIELYINIIQKVCIKAYQWLWCRSLHQPPGPVLSAACLLQQWGYWCFAVCLKGPESHSHWRKYFTLDIKLISVTAFNQWCEGYWLVIGQKTLQYFFRHFLWRQQVLKGFVHLICHVLRKRLVDHAETLNELQDITAQIWI